MHSLTYKERLFIKCSKFYDDIYRISLRMSPWRDHDRCQQIFKYNSMLYDYPDYWSKEYSLMNERNQLTYWKLEKMDYSLIQLAE